MNEWTSCWCSGTPIGALVLLLVLRHSCWCFGTPAAAKALLLHEQARPDRCSSTPVGATALLLREQARPDRCSGTPVTWADTSCTVLRHPNTVLYLWVLIVLRPTHFL